MDGVDGVRVDVLGVNDAVGSDAAGGPNGEPSAACADVGYVRAGAELEDVHDALNLELLVAGGVFEDGEITGVGGAGGVRRGRRRGDLGVKRQGPGEQGGG